MKIHYSLLISFVMMLGLSSCLKNDNYDPALQAQQDDAAIVKFLADKNIVADKHSSGLYYQIIAPGAGNFAYANNTQVTVNYTGRLLSGTVFDKSSASVAFPLGQLIVGWQIGIPLIQKGGKIRIFVPSQYGYGPQGAGQIPANAVLDFDIELVDVK